MLCDIILKQVVFLKYYQFLTFVHIILVLEISTNTLSDKNKLCLPFCSLTSFDYVFFKSNMEANTTTTRLITSSLETTVYLVLDLREITRGNSVVTIKRKKIVTVGSSALQFAPYWFAFLHVYIIYFVEQHNPKKNSSCLFCISCLVKCCLVLSGF